MINRKEIDEKAQEFEIHCSNVERDYIFGWFLFGLFTISSLKNIIFLKGGNALRKGYFSNTRFSFDLDLGIPNDINIEELVNEINKICDFIQEKSGIIFVKENIKVEEKFTASEAPIPDLRVYEARIYFRDFYGNAEHITMKIAMDITRFDKTLLPIQKVKLIHPYSDSNLLDCEIRCMKLEEIIATKLKCLLQRQHAPDLFDYVYSIKLLGGELNREEIIRTFIQKTIFGRNPHILKDILCKMPFDYFKEFWGKSIICTQSIIFSVDDAIAIFLEEIQSAFNIFPNNGFGQYAFFTAELRLPIMKAGREQTLIKMKYAGQIRMIEPYSIKYLQRKDGQEKEYFYGYDQTGGLKSSPGLKSFLADGVEFIENTEEKFTPKFQIELSKSGERPENPYLFDPNKPLKQPKRKITVSFGQTRQDPKYIYQCSTCGKKFYRKTQGPSKSEHKNKFGYSCYGYGVYVGMKY